MRETRRVLTTRYKKEKKKKGTVRTFHTCKYGLNCILYGFGFIGTNYICYSVLSSYVYSINLSSSLLTIISGHRNGFFIFYFFSFLVKFYNWRETTMYTNRACKLVIFQQKKKSSKLSFLKRTILSNENKKKNKLNIFIIFTFKE